MAPPEGEQDEGADGTDFAPQRPQVPTPRHVFRWFDRDLRLALSTRRFGKRAAFNSLFCDRARRAHEFPSHLAQVHEDRLVILDVERLANGTSSFGSLFPPMRTNVMRWLRCEGSPRPVKSDSDISGQSNTLP